MKTRNFKAFGAAEAVGTVIFASALIVYPDSCVEGVYAGLKICASVLIPSLFPFMAVSCFAAASSAFGNCLRIFSPLMRYVFRLPGCAAAAVFFGFTGGYPVGCTVASGLLSKGAINTEQASRISLFCVNAGPAFVITAVGSVMLGSTKAGVILYVSQLVSAIITGFLLGLTVPLPEKETSAQHEGLNCSEALVYGVEKACTGMLRICAWSVLFSCILHLLYTLSPYGETVDYIACILEVTAGCSSHAGKENLCVIAATLGWGGLCVGCQLLGNIREFGTGTLIFFVFRAVQAGLCAVTCGLLLRFFPIEASVFSSAVSPQSAVFSFSLPATLVLLCLSAVFIIDLDRAKKIC